MLLDDVAPAWRSKIQHAGSLSTTLAHALEVTVDARELEQRAASYDGAALHAAEVERGAKYAAVLARYRAQLIDGPVVTLPLQHMKIEFDPNEVESLRTRSGDHSVGQSA